MADIVTSQPGMPIKAAGLETLNSLNQLTIDQKMEWCEVVSGFETKNKYQILNNRGEEVFFMREETDCCTRQCCGPNRPFEFILTDNLGQEVLRLERGFQCSFCCWPNLFCCKTCTDYEMSVQNGAGIEMGSIILESVCMSPTLSVKDDRGNVIYQIVGDSCQCSFGGDLDYRIIAPDSGQEVGSITKIYNGCLQEVFTDKDKFSITFPVGASHISKAILIGAVINIDFLFFESQSNNN